MTKCFASIQVSAGEAGFLEGLFSLYHDVIAASKANLSIDYQQNMYMELTKYLIVQLITCMKD